MEKLAVVLSGGGACGAYQIGVWKALRKLHISYDIVTGTSVGALNGLMMVQQDYHLAKKVWSNLNYELLFSSFDNSQTLSDKEVYLKYADEFIKNGGMDVTKLELLITEIFSAHKFYRSNVDFGIVVYNLTKLKAENVLKKDLTADNVKDYLIASSTCYPAFKIKEINAQKYIDGGYSDNLPINLAITLGATKVIAVDLQQIGIKKKVKYDTEIKYIRPRNEIGSFLLFKKNVSKKNMKYGYNDTMKEFGKLKGDKYTFYRSGYDSSIDRITRYFITYIENTLFTKNDADSRLLKDEVLKKILKLDSKNIRKKVVETMEFLGQVLKLDDSNIYTYSYYNFMVKRILQKKRKFNKQFLEEQINKKRIKKFLGSADIVLYIYDCLLQKETEVNLKLLFHLFSKEFFAAIYLIVID